MYQFHDKYSRCGLGVIRSKETRLSKAANDELLSNERVMKAIKGGNNCVELTLGKILLQEGRSFQHKFMCMTRTTENEKSSC